MGSNIFQNRIIWTWRRTRKSWTFRMRSRWRSCRVGICGRLRGRRNFRRLLDVCMPRRTELAVIRQQITRRMCHPWAQSKGKEAKMKVHSPVLWPRQIGTPVRSGYRSSRQRRLHLPKVSKPGKTLYSQMTSLKAVAIRNSSKWMAVLAGSIQRTSKKGV